MAERTSKFRLSLSVLSLLIVAILSTTALKIANPHKNHNGALESGKGEDITHWHGLDYEYGMFDHVDDDGEEGSKKNVTQQNSSSSPENKTSEATNSYEYSDEWRWGWGSESYEDDDYSAEEQRQQHHDKITIKNKNTVFPVTAGIASKTTASVVVAISKKPAPSESSQANLTNKENGEEKREGDQYNWKGEDDDDGLGDDKAEQQNKVNNLPTDNDIDVDKYFNPDRYQDQIRLHRIEDQLMRVWTVQYPQTHLSCILLRGDIRLIVPVNPTLFNRESVEIVVPQDAEASGTCNSLNNDYQEINLKWNVSVPGKDKVYQNSVYFAFATNWTSEFTDMKVPADKYALVAITVVYYTGEIGNGNNGLMSYSVSDLVEYLTPLNQSMSCYKDNQQMIIGNMELVMSNIQLEAFRPNLETLPVGEFARSVLCTSDEVYVFDAVMTYIIWFWIGALLMVLFIFGLLLALGYRRRRCQEDQGGFGYKILSA